MQMTFLMYRFTEFPEPVLRYVVLPSGVITFFFIISVWRRWNGGGPIRLLLLNYQVGVRLIFTIYIYTYIIFTIYIFNGGKGNDILS